VAKFSKRISRIRRHQRIRRHLKGTSERPRLCVFKSNKYIYGQIIDDSKGVTLVSASSIETDLREKFKSRVNKQTSEEIGKLIAERALEKGIKKIVFDRGGFMYHGNVKAFAEAARSAGLEF
jgi:large subunit ribosomal protein L18